MVGYELRKTFTHVGKITGMAIVFSIWSGFNLLLYRPGSSPRCRHSSWQVWSEVYHKGFSDSEWNIPHNKCSGWLSLIGDVVREHMCSAFWRPLIYSDGTPYLCSYVTFFRRYRNPSFTKSSQSMCLFFKFYVWTQTQTHRSIIDIFEAVSRWRKNVLDKIVTCEVHFSPETKQIPCICATVNFHARRNLKILFTQKLMRTVSYDWRGILLNAFVPRSTTVSAGSYFWHFRSYKRPYRRKGVRCSVLVLCWFITTLDNACN